MKAITAVIILASLVAPAAAGKPQPPKKKAPEEDALKKLNLGDAYGLRTRKSASPKPADVTRPDISLLNENQMTRVIKDHLDDVQYCWMRLPRGKRTVSSAILVIAVEPVGTVKSVEVNGDLPASVGTCIKKVASRWIFPSADAASEVSHGLTLTTTGLE